MQAGRLTDWQGHGNERRARQGTQAASSAAGSGAITEAEIRDMFLLMDIDGTGALSADQIEVAMRALGYNPTTAELKSKRRPAKAKAGGSAVTVAA